MKTTKKAAPAKVAAKKAPAAKPVAKKAPVAKPVAKKAVAAKPAKKAAPAPKAAKQAISPELRYKMIQVAAYYEAEKHGFNGDSAYFWTVAEKQINALIGE